MRFIDEYRDAGAAAGLARAIRETVRNPWAIMEMCGGQTHTILKFSLEELLPPGIELVHGPGCPVCVTPVEMIDKAIAVSSVPGVIFCSFGDMLRVPGSSRSLFDAKAAGADVRVVYSPMDALETARSNPGREVVFFAIGFETTAPANATAAHEARRRGQMNFSLLVSQVLVPPAIRSILSAEDNRVQGFLAAGHVCTIMGTGEYEPIAERYRVPIVVTGFEPLDILEGIYLCVKQLESGRHEVENQYARSVSRGGNQKARSLLEEVFRVVPMKWRGIGEIAHSGLALRPEFSPWDAEAKFGVAGLAAEESSECRSGEVLRGVLKPSDCPAFGTLCDPDHPLGAPMVSSEGACAAYHRYRRRAAAEVPAR
ncbi:MAG: hydrogenase formation protein HypD [Elusimicrobia bacterium RIFCSPHIGHO2_01_FULL_64_10]|nr:MAG: hydrogenase formation protein HypD [Elusimicrobia bacterium RIFCSPHIGHO2_01_FULL_64_10]